MKNIVFILGNYYPNYSATAKCAGNIANVLTEKNNVIIISSKTTVNENDIEFHNKQKIVRIQTKNNRLRQVLNKEIRENIGIKKKINILRLKLVQGIAYLKCMLSKNSLKRDLIKAYIDALDNIKEDIDIIIPVSFPYESIEAAIEYAKDKPQIKIIPLLFDPLVESNTLHRNKINKSLKEKKHLELEKRMIENSKLIISIYHQREHFLSRFKEYIEKFIFIEHPLLINYENLINDIDVTDENFIKLIYTGTFDSKIRNPEYFLKIAKLACEKLDMQVNMFTFGNCEKIIKKYELESKIKNNDPICFEEAMKNLADSNILISVGNIDNHQAPSKIFDYIALGKPIVHFYRNDFDINIEILNKYPLALCLRESEEELENNLKSFIDFCVTNKDSRLKYEDVQRIFYYAEPKYVADMLGL